MSRRAMAAALVFVLGSGFSKTQWVTYGPPISGTTGPNTISGITIDPQATGLFYDVYVTSGQIPNTTGRENGIWKGSNSGFSWAKLTASGTPPSPPNLAIDPTDSMTFFAGSPNAQFFKTTDGGSSWSAVYNGVAPTSWGTAAISADGTVVYVRTAACGGTNDDCKVMKSVSSGDVSTWAQVGGDMDLPTGGPNSIALDPTDSSTLYVGFNGGAYKTTDGGSSFSSSGLSGLNVRVIRISSPSSTVYAIASNAVYESTDSGGTWTSIDSGLTGTAIAQSLAVDPVDPTILYATTDNAVSGSRKVRTTGNSTSLPA